jgi:hypothetical protein
MGSRLYSFRKKVPSNEKRIKTFLFVDEALKIDQNIYRRLSPLLYKGRIWITLVVKQ